jgi:hypothetical protein
LSKTKNKTSTEIRHLIGENKRLQKQVKRLERMLEKYTWLDLPVQPDVEEVKEIQEQNELFCHSCGRGTLSVVDIMGRIFGTCNVCGERKKLK